MPTGSFRFWIPSSDDRGKTLSRISTGHGFVNSNERLNLFRGVALASDPDGSRERERRDGPTARGPCDALYRRGGVRLRQRRRLVELRLDGGPVAHGLLGGRGLRLHARS